ncbi:ubiquitin carboxyl-terminal hydrolase 30-like isoform X2 [Acanthaster planci]|uniref:ubiquitinyl hydrolase 1 n=1 Tax=Acanthaster planci TaxID=133434 RepID=A0A8B7XXS5_ACAPL|nr:ubiquitin carboxyl-terminal hydrolase 30-like isoform X2 [Acanthaster planci]
MLTPSGRLIIPEKFIPFLGVGAAVAVTLTYIFWGPDDAGRGSKAGTGKRRKVAGLENLGNTCYLNTILQSLASCPAFVRWLSRALRQGFFKGKRNELAYKLSKTLEVVNDHSAHHDGSQVYSPHEVLHALYNCSWRADRDQQDAHELFQFLLSVLGEEKEPVPSPVPLCDASKLIEPGRNGLTAAHSDLHSNIEADLPKVACRDGESPFRGLLANHLTCTVCGHRNPVTYSSFDCLTLPIPATVFGALSLECILAKFTQRELVHDVECIECSNVLTGRFIPSKHKNSKKVASTTSRRITPPTPKKVPSASSISVEAAPALSTTPPPASAVTSTDAPPTSQAALSSAFDVPHAQLESTAPPICYQRNGNLHVKTPPTEKLPSKSGRDDFKEETNGRDDDVAASSAVVVTNGSDAVLCYRASSNMATDASPGFAVAREELQAPNCGGGEKSTPICNGSLKTENTEEMSNVSSHFEQNGIETRGQDVIDPSYEMAREGTIQTNEDRCQTQCSNGNITVWELESPVSDCLAKKRQAESRKKKTKGNVHCNGTVEVEKCTGPEASSLGQNSFSKVTPPRWQSTPKPHPQPMIKETTASSADQIDRTRNTPTSSVFGRIPGTGAVTQSPFEVVSQPGGDDESEESSTKCRRMFLKQLTLGKLPQCLCIHLQRVTWLTNGLPSRREEHVMFPEYLDMSPYKQMSAVSSVPLSRPKLMRWTSDLSDDGATPVHTPQSSQSFIGGSFLTDPAGRSLVGGGLGQMSPRISHHATGTAEDSNGRTRVTDHSGEVNGIPDAGLKPTEARYRLASAVVHVGDAFSGHFLTFRRAPSVGNEPLSDSWLCISDECVYTSTAKEVFSQKAYMLYYQRT